MTGKGGSLRLTISMADAGDAAEIGAFQTLCWKHTYRGIVPDAYLDSVTTDMRVERWRARILGGERRVVTARDSRRIVGVASTAPTGAGITDLPALELCSLYVDPVAQGAGVGSALIDAAIGSHDAHLQVFSSNTHAQRFYTARGFVDTGERLSDTDTGIELQRWVRRHG